MADVRDALLTGGAHQQLEACIRGTARQGICRIGVAVKKRFFKRRRIERVLDPLRARGNAEWKKSTCNSFRDGDDIGLVDKVIRRLREFASDKNLSLLHGPEYPAAPAGKRAVCFTTVCNYRR